MTKTKWFLTAFALIAVIFAVISTQITIFMVEPIGAVPEGKTIIIKRLENYKFLDNASSVCEREQGGVSAWCRIKVLLLVADKENTLVKLPYIEFLYHISGGE